MNTAAKRSVLSLIVMGMVSFGFAISAADQTEVPFVEGQGPPDAKPNEAWCLVRKPATYKTVTEQVQVAPATSYIEFIPAKWETRDEQVQVQPETKRAVVVPAKYKTETFQHMVKAESTELEIVPAQYQTVDEIVTVTPESEDVSFTPGSMKTVTEQVLVAPAYAYWKENPGMGPGDIKCYCRCEVPAKYVTITKCVVDKEPVAAKTKKPAVTKVVQVQKLVKDAEVRKKVVPAQFVTMTRQVVETPAEVKWETVPAKFETIQKQVQVAPEGSRKVEVPAKFETMTKQTLDQPERLVWRKKSCDCKEIVRKYKEVPGTDEQSLRMLISK
ncbi:MAG TPA: hypothetical protein VEJ63_07920 [Planctomycetota bacterium]|nr:hypothetical protein [Planctomycetota bacterium]